MMKRQIYLILAMILIPAFSIQGQSAKKYIKAGETFVKSSMYEEAAGEFSKAIELEPTNADAYLARAMAYEKIGKFETSYADYDKALIFDPKGSEIMLGFGRLCNKMGRYDEALTMLHEATAVDKRNGDIYPEKVLAMIGLQKYDQALRTADTALLFKESAENFFMKGRVYVLLNNDIMGKKEFERALSKEKTMHVARLYLAEILIREGNLGEALGHCNTVIQADDKNVDAYVARSKIYVNSMDFPNAINDISKNILIEPENPAHYFTRGSYYQRFNQHGNAVNDFNKVIQLKPGDPDAYFSRAKSFEEVMNYAAAAADYEKITELSEFDMKARKNLAEARNRLYEIHRESIPPEIILTSPVPDENVVEIRGDAKEFLIAGKIKDKSDLEAFTINGKDVHFEQKGDAYEFLARVSSEGIKSMNIVARDIYKNEKVMKLGIKFTEVDAPKVTILTPYASDDGQIMLNTTMNNIFVEGRVSDESRIKSIFIEGVTASYAVNELNPAFTATIDVLNKNKIIVVAEDIYGNIKSTEFTLNRAGAQLSETNPMGKTWVVFIENSNYSTFASLEGPVKDINLMKRAFANYEIHNIIHKKDLKKEEMERFFSIELRDLIKTNQVKSLLVWYAGHGKFINDVGYWIPVDAKRDEEFTYFNIGGLRASMEAYVNYLTHTLVITDACESGPSFYQAMRSGIKERSCDDWQATQFKSSQVFSSAGYELALDDSQFTRTFANALANNPNACIPIEEIVTRVSVAVAGNNSQKPQFGKITGLKDEDGTFFFMLKK